MGCSLMKTTAVDLNEEDVDFLTSNTQFSPEEIQTWYKSFQMECPDGKLTKKKFVEIYKMFFASGNPEKFCEHVFRAFDDDSSGWINFKEFLLAIGVTTGSDPKAKLKWAFKMYDINKDGLIDAQEMAKIIKALYEMLGPDETGKEGEEGDGEDGGPVDHSRKVQFIFDKIDTNKDGTVTLDEFIEVCHQDATLARLLTIGSAS